MFFERNPVGDDDNAAVLQRGVQQQRLAQEHHRERFTRARGVPDHAAFATAAAVALIDALDQCLDAERLLIAGGDLAGFLVKQDEEAHELQQAFRAEQADQQSVLLGG